MKPTILGNAATHVDPAALALDRTPEPSVDEVHSQMAVADSSPGSEACPVSHPENWEEDMDEISVISDNRTPRDQYAFNHRMELKDIASRNSQVDQDDPELNPTSPSFDVYKWAKVTLSALDQANVKLRRVSYLFRNLTVSGSGSATNLQTTVGSVFMIPFRIRKFITGRKEPSRDILSKFEGVVKSGEILLVLGRPGSGCSTFLRTMAGEIFGLTVDRNSMVHYNGIPQDAMIRNFKGEIIYNSEVDHHFPYLSVKQTLKFAATVRTPQNRVLAVSRKDNIQRIVEVVMAICGLSRSQDTRVGNDFVRGVSGGERKRVSIAEMILATAPLGCWDNSTRGLDAATALNFVEALRTSADVFGMTHAVSLYQASQAIYDTFDKVIVLYQGKEIFFGPAKTAKSYFVEMGWECPTRQTTGDFLTSVTNHRTRKSRPGYEGRIPRTPSDFEQFWLTSNAYHILQAEIDQHQKETAKEEAAAEFKSSRAAVQAKHVSSKSPYIVSVPMQIRACLKRANQRLWNDKISTLTVVLGQIIMALIVGSVFFGSPNNTSSFFARGSTLFFAVLLNALIAITEVNSLYQQRPIVEKQASYAFCHPFAEALAGVISDAPVKLVIAICFNLILYFLAGLRAEPSQFFIFFLFTVMIRFIMSAIFRTVAAATKKNSQALAISGVLVLAIVIYTGYTIPRPYMHPWFKWLTYINPLAYAFEALMVNEFHGREFPCASLIPSNADLTGNSFICSVTGAVAGRLNVSGDAYVQASFQYSYSHIWRNLGILIGFWIFFLILYLWATELNSATSSAADVLVFRQGYGPKKTRKAMEDIHEVQENTEPATPVDVNIENYKTQPLAMAPSTFVWRDVIYDINLNGKNRRLLDHVSGCVKAGTLTALMGVSGAGKTTLLDVLAQRVSVGVVTGDMLLNGSPLKSSFPRKAGYVQQQDLHLETSTVREAFCFSAMLRRPKSVSKEEKVSHVEDVIKMLGIDDFAEAIVGIPGEGLNVEQRKLLTIGVELAAKPDVLLFLDEPTSGLDSQSSWAIVSLLRKLANNGQAVLATIHQPSSILFEEFDELLFLAKGGRTVYFGEIGKNSHILLEYFQRQGIRSCGKTENPAEYILEAVTAGANGDSGRDWPEIWKSSNESRCKEAEQDQIQTMRRSRDGRMVSEIVDDDDDEFAAPIFSQIWHTTVRIFQQYWRTPSYIWGKILLGGVSALFIGFSFFNSNDSLQGLQNVVFSIFMLTSILSSLVQQVIPRFVIQRSLYEVRESPSKTYSWIAFLVANILAEIPYQVILGILVFGCYYYPIFGIQSSERQGLILLFCIQIFVFASTFAHLVISALPDPLTAGAVATILFSLTMIFNGVFQPPQALPGFWIFMYRVSPLTYIVDGIAATGLHGKKIKCSGSEIKIFNPPSETTCGNYLEKYLTQAPGQLLNPLATDGCQYCPLSNADQMLSLSGISWGARWENFGIGWSYIVFNIFMAMGLYYAFRVRKWKLLSQWKPGSIIWYWMRVIGFICSALVVGVIVQYQ